MVVAALPAGLVLLSYINAFVRRHMAVLTYALFYALMGWSIALAALSGFAPNYAVWLLFTFIALSIGHSMGLSRPEPLLGFFVASLAGTGVAFAMTAQSAVDPALFMSCFVLVALLYYAALHLRIYVENRLADSQARSGAVLDQTSDGVYLAEAGSLRFLEANPAFCQLIGYTPDALQARTVDDILLAEEDDADVRRAHRLEEGTHRVAECRYRHRDGTAIEVEVSISAITYDGQEVRCVVVRDIRQRKRTERALRQAKERAEEMLRAKSTMLDNISHELRTPLAAILGYASILHEEVGDPHREFVETIVTNGQRLESTLNTILEFAQLESGEAQFEAEAVAVSTPIETAVEQFSSAAHAKGITLETEAVDTHHQAWVDPSALEQVLHHLLDNAVKFTSEGAVTVQTRTTDAWTVIEVRDTGAGIGAQFVPQAFEEFRQESSGLTRAHAGAGLGLTVVNRLVERMQGRIDIDSEKGKGTVVTVRLPRCEQRHPAPAAAIPAETA